MIYIAIFLFLIFCAHAARNHQTLRYQVYLILIWFLALFTGFRYGVGCDYFRYINHYNISQVNPDFLQNREVGHQLLITGLNSLGFGSQAMFLAYSLMFFVGFHAFARRQPYPLAYLALSFPFLLINMPMAAVRQAAALGLIFFALNAFVDRKLIRFSVFVLIATLFHTSAASMFFLAFFLIPKIRPRFFRWLFPAVFLGLAVAGFLSVGFLETAEDRYIDSDIEAAGAVPRLSLIALSAAFFILFLRKRWKALFPKDYELALVGSLTMFALFFLLPFSSVIADRLGYYFLPIQLMIFARIPSLQFRRNKLLLTTAPYVVFGAAFSVWIATSIIVQRCYVPYDFRFDLFFG